MQEVIDAKMFLSKPCGQEFMTLDFFKLRKNRALLQINVKNSIVCIHMDKIKYFFPYIFLHILSIYEI
ncbi:hypothetical protein BpHYR1_041549 [Brachionus plicatilis]|uniref:Uncharacterized protein n=1 Tax=Brachionus plicatilis TaxID=10195 RepID=A0A3M7QG58_BRAPC|nr:hypothetical protein BpHYR1_041549 [Brachionus plicatilis]